MKKTLLATVLAAATALSAASIAQAAPAKGHIDQQPQVQLVKHYKKDGDSRRGSYGGVLPSHLIKASLYKRGFRDVDNVYYRYGYYYATARGYRGPVKLKISARSAEIVSIERIGYGHGYGSKYGSKYGSHGPKNGVTYTHKGNGFSFTFGLY